MKNKKIEDLNFSEVKLLIDNDYLIGINSDFDDERLYRLEDRIMELIFDEKTPLINKNFLLKSFSPFTLEEKFSQLVYDETLLKKLNQLTVILEKEILGIYVKIVCGGKNHHLKQYFLDLIKPEDFSNDTVQKAIYLLEKDTVCMDKFLDIVEYLGNTAKEETFDCALPFLLRKKRYPKQEKKAEEILDKILSRKTLSNNPFDICLSSVLLNRDNVSIPRLKKVVSINPIDFAQRHNVTRKHLLRVNDYIDLFIDTLPKGSSSIESFQPLYSDDLPNLEKVKKLIEHLRGNNKIAESLFEGVISLYHGYTRKEINDFIGFIFDNAGKYGIRTYRIAFSLLGYGVKITKFLPQLMSLLEKEVPISYDTVYYLLEDNLLNKDKVTEIITKNGLSEDLFGDDMIFGLWKKYEFKTSILPKEEKKELDQQIAIYQFAKNLV